MVIPGIADDIILRDDLAMMATVETAGASVTPQLPFVLILRSDDVISPSYDGDDRINDCQATSPRSATPRAAARARRRRAAAVARQHAVALCTAARALGDSMADVAATLDIVPRTLSSWCHRVALDGQAVPVPGRPPRLATTQQREDVMSFLTCHGPGLTLATLQAEYAEVTRAELGRLLRAYRREWRRTHAEERCELTWLRPGSVWAMDFSHPPHLIDGCFRAILNVRDLASHQQLLWLAVEHEDAATVREALLSLFPIAGAPLVLKCDNGPAFRAAATKELLDAYSIFGLDSPPYCPSHNGACERSNRTLKGLTEHVAELAGRSGFWTSDDLVEARWRANRLRRPWGASEPTPEERWEKHPAILLDERDRMRQDLKSGIAAVREQRGIDDTAALPHYTQTEIERIVAQPVLETLGLLHVRRRVIAPAI